MRDGNGRVRIVVSADDAGSRFFIFDENGEARVGADYAESGASLFLRDAAGRVRIGLDESNGQAIITLTDAKERSRIEISAPEESSPQVVFYDQGGRATIAIEAVEDSPTISLLDEMARVTLLLNGGARPSILIHSDEKGLSPIAQPHP